MTATLTGAGLERLRDAYPHALASVRTNVIDHLDGFDLAAFAEAVGKFATAETGMLSATARPPPACAPGGMTGTGGWHAKRKSHRRGGTRQPGEHRLTGFRRPTPGSGRRKRARRARLQPGPGCPAGRRDPGWPATLAGPRPWLARDPGWPATLAGPRPWLARDPGWPATLAGPRPWLARDPGWPATLAGPRPWLARDPGWPATLAGPRPWLDRGPAGSRARLDQLWTVKSELSEAGVPICTW